MRRAVFLAIISTNDPRSGRERETGIHREYFSSENPHESALGSIAAAAGRVIILGEEVGRKRDTEPEYLSRVSVHGVSVYLPTSRRERWRAKERDKEEERERTPDDGMINKFIVLFRRCLQRGADQIRGAISLRAIVLLD